MNRKLGLLAFPRFMKGYPTLNENTESERLEGEGEQGNSDPGKAREKETTEQTRDLRSDFLNLVETA